MIEQIKYWLLIIKYPKLGFSIVIGATISYFLYAPYLTLLNSTQDLNHYYFGVFIMACILAGYMLVKFIETTFEKIISKLKLIINEKRKEKNLSESIGNTYSYLTYSQLKVVNTLMNGPCKYKNDHSDIITLQQNGYIVKHEKTNNQENIYKINPDYHRTSASFNNRAGIAGV